MNDNYLLFRFVPTMRCNYRCNYCFVPAKEKLKPVTLFDRHPPEDWVAAMGQWADYDVEFYCWGGEPFLLKGTYEIIKGWTSYPHVIPGSRIDTNLAFTDQIIEKCRTNKIKWALL